MCFMLTLPMTAFGILCFKYCHGPGYEHHIYAQILWNLLITVTDPEGGSAGTPPPPKKNIYLIYINYVFFIPFSEMPTVPFLQYLVLFSSCKYLWFWAKCLKILFFLKDHFVYTSMEKQNEKYCFSNQNTFFILKNTFFFRKRLASLNTWLR